MNNKNFYLKNKMEGKKLDLSSQLLNNKESLPECGEGIDKQNASNLALNKALLAAQEMDALALYEKGAKLDVNSCFREGVIQDFVEGFKNKAERNEIGFGDIKMILRLVGSALIASIMP